MKFIQIKNVKTIELVLRIAVFMTFLGHGIVAIIGSPIWVVYIQTIGFSFEYATSLLPLIGILDLIVAVSILLKPNKYVVLWAVVWAFSTALIRPIAGESIWAFVERGANWGAPLSLYVLLIRK